MAKKILIVDDEERYRKRFGQWASESGYEIIEATTMDEAFTLLTKEKPDAIVTDHGLNDGARRNGNDLSRLVKQSFSIPIAGISGGGSDVFDASVVDIRESKSITKENYAHLLACLLSGNPKNYRPLTNPKHSELLAAASILFQGYFLAKALQQGLDEIVSEGQIIIPREQMQEMRKITRNPAEMGNIAGLFEMFKTELDANKLYEQACNLNAKLKEDTRFRQIFEHLAKADFGLSLDDAVYAYSHIPID